VNDTELLFVLRAERNFSDGVTRLNVRQLTPQKVHQTLSA
jgi:hypothetical protein